jgi:hypothetical protein
MTKARILKSHVRGKLSRVVREWRREPVLSEAEGWATAPPTMTWAALSLVCVGIGLVSSLVNEFYQRMKIFHDTDHFINQRVPASLRQF